MNIALPNLRQTVIGFAGLLSGMTTALLLL